MSNKSSLEAVQRLKDEIPILKKLKKADKKTQEKYIKNGESNRTCIVCSELCKNFVNKKFPLTKKKILTLKPYANQLKLLSLKSTPLHARKKSLVKGGFLSALLATLLPTVVGLIADSIARKKK